MSLQTLSDIIGAIYNSNSASPMGQIVTFFASKRVELRHLMRHRARKTVRGTPRRRRVEGERDPTTWTGDFLLHETNRVSDHFRLAVDREIEKNPPDSRPTRPDSLMNIMYDLLHAFMKSEVLRSSGP